MWNGAVADRFAGFGQTGDTPVVAKWVPQPILYITFTPSLTIIPSTTVFIPVGGKVIWKNMDPLHPHGVVALDSQTGTYFGGMTPIQIPYGMTFEVTFDTVGRFAYSTTFQPETTGQIIVTN